MGFNYDVEGIDNCEVRATSFLGSVRLNSVRRNSDYKLVDLDQPQRRDLLNVARWYFQDELAGAPRPGRTPRWSPSH
jgi:hypothetical protein